MGSLLPIHAQAVIIGPVIINSGIVGYSTAYPHCGTDVERCITAGTNKNFFR